VYLPTDVDDLSAEDHTPTDLELQNCAKPIALVWKAVGLELGLDQQDINIIAADHVNLSCVDACKAMLFHWKKSRIHASWKKLNQAIEKHKTITGKHSYVCVVFYFRSRYRSWQG